MPSDLFGERPAIEPPDGDKGREERGAFFTPEGLARAICLTLRDEFGIQPRSIFEPGCGGGAFLRAAAETWPGCREILGVDLVPACKPTDRFDVKEMDLFRVTPARFGRFDLVLGNPDFGIAERVVRHGMTLLKPGGHVAFLLLCGFEESRERVQFWREHPMFARKAIGAPRPAFRADGQTDMRPYALTVWKDGHQGNYRGYAPLVWRG